ncbi:MAG: methylenetetrahydrofolate reductase [Spirochaetota bacterium]|nr:methylenetetrahydrofolate reductase [Spirochaetota bacterium]
MGLIDSLQSGNFVIIAEIDPPKGTDTSSLLETVNHLKGRVDALLVTDMPSAVMKMGSIATGSFLKNQGFDIIANITCRDKNVIALQSDILSASFIGIENIYITDGDDITFGDHPHAKAVNEVTAVELISIVAGMKNGVDHNDNTLDGTPKLNTGAYLNFNTSEKILIDKIEHLRKQDVTFFITDAVFDLEAFGDFSNKVKHLNIPIIANMILLKSAATARFLNKHVNGVDVPDSIIERLTSAGDKQKESMAITAELINGLKSLCNGVNIMAMGWEAKIPYFLDAAKV